MEGQKNSAKQVLRLRFRKQRAALSIEQKERAEVKICDLLREYLLQWKAEKSLPIIKVAAYLAMKSELSLDALLSGTERIRGASFPFPPSSSSSCLSSDAGDAGLRFYVPRTDLDEDGRLELRFAAMKEPFCRKDYSAGRLGIAEPEREDCEEDFTPDIVLLPCVAVDIHGNRLGQGGACYDRWLARLHGRGLRPMTIACAFAIQKTREVLASEQHDMAVQAIVTEDGIDFCYS